MPKVGALVPPYGSAAIRLLHLKQKTDLEDRVIHDTRVDQL